MPARGFANQYTHELLATREAAGGILQAEPNRGHGMDLSGRRLAFVLVLLSTVTNSTSGLLARSVDTATDWQVVFFRGSTLALTVTSLLVLRYRGDVIREIRRIGRWGVLGGLFYAGTNVCYPLALTHTTVANAMLPLSVIPLFTAVLARVFLKETVRPATWVAMVIACGGIAIMLGDGLAAGTLFGNVMALVAAFCFSGFVVILCRGRTANMLPSTAIGAAMAAAIAAIMSGGNLSVTPGDLAICMTWGGVVTTIAHVLIVFGSRHVAGAELTLLLLVEFILGPIWVLLVYAEVPSSLTVIGGGVVLSAVAVRSILELRRLRD